MKNNQKGEAAVIAIIIIIILIIAACAGLGYIILNKNNKKTNVEVPTNKIAEEVSALNVELDTISLSKFGDISKDNIKAISKNVIQIKDGNGNLAIYNAKLTPILEGFEAEYGNENLVVVSKDKTYGMINIEGNEILKPMYYGIKVYSNNVIAVQLVTNSQVLFGLVNGEGKEILPCEYASFKYYSDDLILVGNSEGYLVVDSKGTTKLKISDADYFNIDIVNDTTLIAMDNTKWKYGLMDLEENALVEYKYDRIEALNSKYVKAEENGLWGVIDLEGNIIVPFNYKWAMDISIYGDLFKIEEDSKLIYYNKKGKAIYETEDTEIQIVTEGKYLVTEKETVKSENNESTETNTESEVTNKYHLIDNDGGYLDDISGADEVYSNGKDLVIYKASNKFGLIDSSLNVITANIYKELVVNDFCCTASNKDGTKYGIISKKGETLLSQDYSYAEYLGDRENYEMILFQKENTWQLVIAQKV